MKKRIIILLILASLLFYASLFLTNIAFDIQNPNDQHFINLKINTQNTMLEIYGDLELAFINCKHLPKDEKKDLDKKLNKMIENYNKTVKSKNPKDMSQFFYNFCYHAELIEYKINKDMSYLDINDKYQEYISTFYQELEFVKQKLKN